MIKPTIMVINNIQHKRLGQILLFFFMNKRLNIRMSHKNTIFFRENDTAEGLFIQK